MTVLWGMIVGAVISIVAMEWHWPEREWTPEEKSRYTRLIIDRWTEFPVG